LAVKADQSIVVERVAHNKHASCSSADHGGGKRARRTAGIRAMITPELLEKLRARAAEEHPTLSTMIELLLERGVERNEFCSPAPQRNFWGASVV
jgi:hypothetical protein